MVGKEPLMIIGFQNLSTLVSGQDAYDMILLINHQLREHVAPAWGLLPPRVEFVPSGGNGRHYDAMIGILDDPDQANVLGWHDEGPDASVYGRVFARPVLDNGGNALTADLSVCSVGSHEAVETLLDSACDLWAQRPDGSLTAREGCDAVEGDSYRITITAGHEEVTGTVSDFLLPAWFDPDAAPGPTDYLGLCTFPFQLRPAGYLIVMSGGAVSQQWGESYPEWRKATKETPAARTARRLAVQTSLA
jgi:hypothetical protein